MYTFLKYVCLFCWLNGQQSIISIERSVTIKINHLRLLCLYYCTMLPPPPSCCCASALMHFALHACGGRSNPTLLPGRRSIHQPRSPPPPQPVRHSLCVTSRLYQTSIDANDIFLPDHSPRRANTLLFETALPPCYSASGNSIAKRVPYAHCF